MTNTVKEVLAFVRENDVKFIRLSFCDLTGTQKNISIMPDDLEHAFESGISFDASSILGFSDVTKSDLFLVPDPGTLRLMPWRPQQGRVIRFYCDIINPDQTPFAFDTRRVLKEAVRRCEQAGYACNIGAECEFYLFKTDEQGDPTQIPLDTGSYLDISPLDKGENVRREICLCLEEMGIKPETSHHEQGPGQNEIDFKYSDPLSSADNVLSFRSVVKAIAAQNGLFASFLPKPIPDRSGSGFHINLSLISDGLNLFRHAFPAEHRIPGVQLWAAESFIAGIMEQTAFMTAFLNPIANSYERFGSFEAPQYISWSCQNRSQLIRIPAATGEKTRMELRSPDPAVNPYLAFALILHAGMDGIEHRAVLPPPVNENMYTASPDLLGSVPRLPDNLGMALSLAAGSSFVKKALGDSLVEKYIHIKQKEADAYAAAEDKHAFVCRHFFRQI